MSYLQVDIAAFKAHVHDLLTAFPELADDEDLRADMFEAETDLHPLIDRLVRMKLDADAMAAAIKARKQDISDRQARYERKADGAKALIKSVMLAADMPKVTLADATVSITKGRTRCVVDDVNALPQGFFEIERKAKTSDIKAELEAGRDVPGAHLELGDEGLMVRVK